MAADLGQTSQRQLIVGAILKMLPLILTLLLLAPVQWLANRVRLRAISRTLPLIFHRVALWCLGVTVTLEGEPLQGGPVLLIGNHISWLDTLMLSSVAPVRFVSKDDVASWPVFGTLARLQNTLFVSRTRRSETAKMTDMMRDVLARKDRLVVFAEGTTSDGGQVLPFRTALLGALVGDAQAVPIQSITICYLRRDGLPIALSERSDIGWYGDLDLLPSLLDIIHGGPMKVSLVLGKPQTMVELGDRKQAARTLQTEVARTLSKRLRQA